VRAAGVSVWRIAVSAALAGLVVAAFLWVIGEYFAPPADQYARQYKIFSRYSQLEFTGSRSAWVRQGTAVHQRAAPGRGKPVRSVYVYRLDDERRLTLVARAETATQDKTGRWVLSNYAETQLLDDHVAARNARSPRDRPEVQRGLPRRRRHPAGGRCRSRTSMLQGAPEGQQPRVRPSSRSRSGPASLASSRPSSVCVFAVPFAFGALRSAGAGARTVLGIMVGVLFVLITQTLESSGQVYGLNPLLVAWGPTALLSAVAAVAIWRTS
jgi:lipopolysaccharide export system permease protein